MTRPAIYIRWSTEDQGQGTTLAVQEEACRQYCEDRGWHVSDKHFYVDDGYSGGTLHRPALTALRQAVEGGQVDVVVVYRLDRLSRSLADATSLVDREWKNRAVVRSATEDVQPELDEGWLNYSFRATFADYERRVIRQRTLSGKIRRLQEGRKVAGRIPYGWRRGPGPGTLVVDEVEAAVVRQLFEKVAREQMGAPALARWANTRGLKRRGGYRWHAKNVNAMLRNPIYAGRIVYGRTKLLKRHRGDPGPWYRTQAPTLDVEADVRSVPPIIVRDVWEETQVVLDKRNHRLKVRGRGVSHPYLLSGLLRCRCGARMGPKSPGSARVAAGKGKVYYRCYSRDAESCAVNPGYVEATWLEQHVETEFLRRVQATGFRERLMGALRSQVSESLDDLRRQLGDVEAELGRLDEQLTYVDDQFLRRVVTIDEARRLRARIQAERDRLKEQQGSLAIRMTQAEQGHQAERLLLRQLDVVVKWQLLTVLEKKQVMAHFIQHIEAYRPRHGGDTEVTVAWTFAVAGPLDPRDCP